MRGDPVVDRQLSAGGNLLQRVDLDVMVKDPQITVGTATVIEVSKAVATRAVQGQVITEFNQIDLRVLLHRLPRLGQSHERSADLAELPASRQGGGGKDAAAVDPAGSNDHRV